MHWKSERTLTVCRKGVLLHVKRVLHSGARPRAATSLILAFVVAGTVCFAPNARPGAAEEALPGAAAGDCKVYHGAWFEVCYPAAFTVHPSLPSRTAEGYDSVLFEAPDGNTAFYVYVPQWGGRPTDIALDPGREILEAEKTEATSEYRVHWFTIAAKDGSYRRSYREMTGEHGAVLQVLGRRYRDEATRQQYADDYQRFCASLTAFAD